MDFLENRHEKTNQDGNKERDEDSVELPLDSLAILQEFLQNKTMQRSLECEEIFEEDWQLSQFWYNDETKRILSRLCLELVLKRRKSAESQHVKVALLSCPSIYRAVKNSVQYSNATVRLFEFDTRFSVFGEDFMHYDYRDVAKYEETLFETYENYFDVIFVDPPFLSQECIEKMAVIVKRIKKDDADVIMCSGETSELWIKNTLNLNKCEFRPEHERNLANEFCSYANFDLDSLLKCQ